MATPRFYYRASIDHKNKLATSVHAHAYPLDRACEANPDHRRGYSVGGDGGNKLSTSV